MKRQPMRKWPRLAIHVPSGSSGDEFKFRVTPDGSQLEVKYQWPKVLIDVSLLHKRWWEADDKAEKIKTYHTVLSSFKIFFRKFRKRESDTITSFAHINLNCIVETNLHNKQLRLKWKDHAVYRMLYVTMLCAKDEYADVSDCKSVQA